MDQDQQTQAARRALEEIRANTPNGQEFLKRLCEATKLPPLTVRKVLQSMAVREHSLDATADMQEAVVKFFQDLGQ